MTSAKALEEIKAMAPQLMAAYLESFKLGDPDPDYNLDVETYFQNLADLGTEEDPEEFKALHSGTHPEARQNIDFADFLSVMALSATDSEEAVRPVFELFDPDGSGDMSRETLERVLGQFGVELTNDEMEALFADADKNNNGRLSLKEFQEILNYSERYIKQKGIPSGV